jgi:hypothetical protein
MSVYRALDKDVASEINVTDITRRRPELASASPQPQPAAKRKDAVVQRKAVPSNTPLPETFRWVASLPREVRPLALFAQFPRIVNVMARTWRDPPAFRDYMFELLIERRGARHGFPDNVRLELLALRAYFDHTHPHCAIGLPHETR